MTEDLELTGGTQITPLVMELMRHRDRLIFENEALKAELNKRPRTEFMAVGWWTGEALEWDPMLKPVRGMLVFRPVPEERTHDIGQP